MTVRYRSLSEELNSECVIRNALFSRTNFNSSLLIPHS